MFKSYGQRATRHDFHHVCFNSVVNGDDILYDDDSGVMVLVVFFVGRGSVCSSGGARSGAGGSGIDAALVMVWASGISGA